VKSEDVATLHIRFAVDVGPFNAAVTVRAFARLSRTVTVRGRPLYAGDHVIATTRVEVVRPRLRRF